MLQPIPALTRGESSSALDSPAAPILAGQPPSTFDPDLGRRLPLGLHLIDKRIAKLARHTSTCLVGFVMVNLDMGDPRDRERRVGQETRRCSRDPSAQKRGMRPVPNLQAPRAHAIVQPATANHSSTLRTCPRTRHRLAASRVPAPRASPFDDRAPAAPGQPKASTVADARDSPRRRKREVRRHLKPTDATPDHPRLQFGRADGHGSALAGPYSDEAPSD